MCFARINSGSMTSGHNVRGVCFRVENVEIWQPELKDLSEEDLDKISKEKERRSRLLRRQIRHMGRQVMPKKNAQASSSPRGAQSHRLVPNLTMCMISDKNDPSC